MARSRVRAAVRKATIAAATRAELARMTPADQIAAGVRLVAVQIADLAKPGSLWWLAPIQYVCEQMAPRICAAHELEADRRDDVAAYLLSGLQEYMHAVAADFDLEHFAAWTAAMEQREGAAG